MLSGALAQSFQRFAAENLTTCYDMIAAVD
jgi:hypothetical protein